jgi:hypothetical protein
MADNDEIVLEDAKEAAFTLDKAYRRAVLNADFDKMTELKPQVDDAYDNYSLARLKLIEKETLTTDADVSEMCRIRAEIDQAATTQAIVAGGIAFVKLIKNFV